MYTMNRYFKKPLQRSTQLLLHVNQRILTTPGAYQTAKYSKFKETDNDSKGKPPKKSKDGEEKGKDKKGPAGLPRIEMRILPALYPTMGYDEKNMKLGRQLSPHLSIYRKQLTSVLSIFLRMSGFVLALGVWVIGISGLYCDLSIDALAKKIESCDCSRTIFNVLKFFVVLPFAYHMVAGTRHLIWYLNVFLTLPQIYATGYVAIALTFIIAGILTVIELEDRNDKEPKNISYSEEVETNIDTLINENVNTTDDDDQYEHIER